MPERDVELPHFRKVPEASITANTIELGGIDLSKPLSADTLYPTIICATKPLRDIESSMIASCIEASPTIEVGLRLARGEMNYWLKRIGRQEVDPVDMRIALLTANKIREFQTKASGKDQGAVLGFAISGINTVAVRVDEHKPEYLTPPSALHELSHCWVDRDINAFTVKQVEHEGKRKFRFFWEPRRIGLEEKKLGTKEVSGGAGPNRRQGGS